MVALDDRGLAHARVVVLDDLIGADLVEIAAEPERGTFAFAGGAQAGENGLRGLACRRNAGFAMNHVAPWKRAGGHGIACKKNCRHDDARRCDRMVRDGKAAGCGQQQVDPGHRGQLGRE